MRLVMYLTRGACQYPYAAQQELNQVESYLYDGREFFIYVFEKQRWRLLEDGVNISTISPSGQRMWVKLELSRIP